MGAADNTNEDAAETIGNGKCGYLGGLPAYGGLLVVCRVILCKKGLRNRSYVVDI
jgi:hypothetical protein